jgi:hypothetical protein
MERTNEPDQTPFDAISRTDRRRGTALDVLTAHFAHANGRRIDIIGVKHFASTGFWALRQSELDHIDADVHYESPLDDSSTWGPWTRLKSVIGKLVDRASRRIWTSAGFAFQFESLHVRDHWRNRDTAASRTLRSIPMVVILALAALQVPVSRIRPLAAAFGRSLARGLLADAGKKQSLRGVMRTRILVDERDEIAANAAIAAGRDVILIWGHAHIPGIGRRLQQNGFELVGTTWRELYDLRR